MDNPPMAKPNIMALQSLIYHVREHIHKFWEFEHGHLWCRGIIILPSIPSSLQLILKLTLPLISPVIVLAIQLDLP